MVIHRLYGLLSRKAGTLAFTSALALGLSLAPLPAFAEEVTEEPQAQQIVESSETVTEQPTDSPTSEPEPASEQNVNPVSEPLPKPEPTVPSEPEASEVTPVVVNDATDLPSDAAGSDGTGTESTIGENEETSADEVNAGPAVGEDDSNKASETLEGLTQSEALPTDDELVSGDAAKTKTQSSLPDAPSGASSKAVVDGKAYVIQALVGDGRVIDAAGRSPKAGSNVAIWSYSGGNNQQWVAQREGSSLWYRLLLAGSNGTLALGLNGTNVCVVSNPSTGSSLLSVLWAFVANTSDTFQLVNASNTKRVVDVTGGKTTNGTNIITYTAGTSKPNNQLFRPVEAKPSVAKGTQGLEGAYTLTLKGSTSLGADVSGGSRNNGANVIVWNSTGAKNQQVYLEPDGKGYYIAWIVGTGKVLDVAGASILPGTNILQWAYNGNDNQKWAVVATKKADGTYMATLQNKATGLMFGAQSATRGGNIAGVSRLASNTSFVLTKQALITEGINVITPLTTSATALDVAGASTGTAKLLLWTNSGGINQRFELQSVGDDLWRIRTASSGGWITWTGGANVRQTGNGNTAVSDANTWRAVWSNGGLSLINVASNKAFDMNGGKNVKGTAIIAFTPNGRDSQHFIFTPTDLFKEGIYFVTSRYAGRRLNIEGGGEWAGANLINYTYDTKKASTGSANEKFKFQKVGDAYRIINVKSGLCIGGNTGVKDADGYDNVAQRKATNADDQLWSVRIGDGGWLEIMNVGTGKYLVSRNNARSADAIWGAYNVVERDASQKASYTNGMGWKLSATTGTVNSNPNNGISTLMVGNSFTYYMFTEYPVMPSIYKNMLSGLGLSGGNVTRVTAGGSSLADHLDPNTSLGKSTFKYFKLGQWDYVTLQEGTTTPIDRYDDYLASLTTLVNMTKEIGATPILYATWAYIGKTSTSRNASGSLQLERYGAAQRAYAELLSKNPKFDSLSKTTRNNQISNLAETKIVEMQKQLQQAFAAAADTTGAVLTNVGKAFENNGLLNKSKRDTLFTEDKKHPAYQGCKIAATTICNTISSLIKTKLGV